MDSTPALAMGGSAEAPSRRSELVGPRPTPLKLRKDPHKIRKPLKVQEQQQHRRPIIIYTLSPKVVHTTPGDFMSVVQRLTGGAAVASSSAPAGPEAPALPFRADAGTGDALFSPAARLAAFEKAAAAWRPSLSTKSEEDLLALGFDGGWVMETTKTAADRRLQTGLFGGILSPGPSSLPWISPSLFEPPSTNLFSELSPLQSGGGGGGGRSFPEMNSFMPIASQNNNFASSGFAASPAAGYWDLLNQQHYDS